MRHLVTVVVALLIVITVMAVSGVLTPGGRERGIAAFKDPFALEQGGGGPGGGVLG